MGSHILDRLRARGIPCALLLRETSSRRFIEAHLSEVEILPGAITDPASLRRALRGITRVIHCAGATRALNRGEFFEINHLGARNVVAAVNASTTVDRLLLISSLAVAGPAGVDRPAREADPPRPLSVYGQSKLAGELEVTSGCRKEFVVVRPPAVYGPRDKGFFSMFQAVARHVLPRPSATQQLSLVYGPDLADAAVRCLAESAPGRTYFVCSAERVTARQMADEIARQMKVWTVPCPLPAGLLWPICAGAELMGRMTGKPTLLNRQKFAELRAPGWVCDGSRLERELGVTCPTTLRQGIAETLSWYRRADWL